LHFLVFCFITYPSNSRFQFWFHYFWGISNTHSLVSIPASIYCLYACANKIRTAYLPELGLSVRSDDAYQREVFLEVASTQHGEVFNVTANRFTQTINLDYDDSCNLTISKRSPFYTTITVNGKVSIYHNQTIWHNNWVSEPYQQREAYTEQEPYTINEPYTTEQTVRIFPNSALILPAALIAVSLIIIRHKTKRQSPKTWKFPFSSLMSKSLVRWQGYKKMIMLCVSFGDVVSAITLRFFIHSPIVIFCWCT